MMVERGRAFTFPDIGVQNPRARTVSERAEEIDLVSSYVFNELMRHSVEIARIYSPSRSIFF